MPRPMTSLYRQTWADSASSHTIPSHSRHNSPNTRGRICLTPVGLFCRRRESRSRRRRQARQEVRQGQEVRHAKESPARAHQDKRITRHVRPPSGQMPQAPIVVRDIDAIFTPRLTTLDQQKRPAVPRVEGMGHTDGSRRTVWIICNRSLCRMRTPSGLCGPSKKNVSTG
jgi:hypothetical protein